MTVVQTTSMRRLSAVLGFGLGVLAPGVAWADGPSESLRDRPVESATPNVRAEAPKMSWRARYERARTRMMDGDYRVAERDLRLLAAEAPSDADRALALEMADLAKGYAERLERATTPVVHTERPVRTTDEITLMYVTSFLYGAGTGVWFLLLTEPDSAATATLPFAAITAAPVIALATVDGNKKLPRGVPHAISAGVYLGLAEGIWLVGYQHGRSGRMEDETPNAQVRWKPESVASVLWGSATLGGVLGGVLGSSLVTTPGRVSFTGSTAIWSGTLTGLTAGALLPENSYRTERAFLASGLGYNAGLLGGMLGAGALSPSVTRVRIVDLLGGAGGLTASGLYLAIAHDPDIRATQGLAALGAGAGLAIGWWVTAGMKPDAPGEPAKGLLMQPSIQPTVGGATLGVVGSL
jgi:hypothetical protein